jgi:hypothetical protein
MHPKGIKQITMTHCPFCEDANELQDYMLNEQEAGQSDAFGRQLGMFVPRGETSIESISLHEYFPENGGIHVEPHEQTINQQMAVRSLEYIALRYPEFTAELRAEEPRELIRLNPIYAEPMLSGYMGYNLSTGMEAYYNHAKLKEVIVQPHSHIPGLEKGAIFASVGDKVARKELMVSVPGEDGPIDVPRVKYHFARFKRWPKNFWSRTVVDDIVPIQRRLNELDSQVIDIRERGKPNMWLPKGTTLYTKDEVEGSFTCIYYDPADPNWTPQQGIFPGSPISGSPYSAEREATLRDAQMVGAPQDIEVGQAPGSVKTTSGLMLLSEEASQKRGPRERSVTRMFESGFEHVLQMNYGFRKDDASYTVQGEGSIFEKKSYKGADLLGAMRVKMVARAGYDVTIYNKEAAGEAIQLGLVPMETPDAKDRILELMKLPKDLNERQHIQIERTEEAWSDFIYRQKIPVPDYRIEDPVTRYAVLGKRWFSDECMILREEAGWDEVVPLIHNWEEMMAAMLLMEMQQRPIYGKVPESQWGTVFKQGQQAVQVAMEAYQQAVKTHAEESGKATDEMAEPLPPPEQPAMTEFPPPPQYGFLPEAPNLRIYEVWMRMLPTMRPGLIAARNQEAAGQRPGPKVKQLMKLDLLLRMRAVIDSYRLEVLQQGGTPPPPGGEAMAPGAAPAA